MKAQNVDRLEGALWTIGATVTALVIFDLIKRHRARNGG